MSAVIPVAEQMSQVLAKVAPLAFDSLNLYNTQAEDCRLANSVWSGFTGVIDGKVRNHKDKNNHPCGAACVINLLAPKSKQHQAHILCNYGTREAGCHTAFRQSILMNPDLLSFR